MASSGSRPSEILLDLLVWGFALWTLLCWIVSVTGQSFALLVALSPLIPGLLWATRGVALEAAEDGRPPDGECQAPSEPRRTWRGRAPASLLAASLALAAAFGAGWWTLGWALACISLLLAASGERWLRDTKPLPKPPPQASVLPWILVAVVAALGVQRPDADDGSYHAITLAAAENPDAPLLCCEVLHGVSGAPLDPPTQRLNSLEPLIAVPVLLLEIAPWRVYHYLLPLLGAVGLCLAYRRLYRRLVPDRWRSALTVTLVLLMTLGIAHAWHGNFGLVRLHQGKGLLVSVMLPLLGVYGLEAGAWGGASRWLRLLAAQVAAIGLNQTALIVAPATALFAVLAALPGRAGGIRPRAAAVAALPAGIGLGLWPIMVPRFEQMVGDQTGAELLQRAADFVFGDGLLAPLVALSLLVCPWCVPPGPARRWATLAPLATLAGPLNPWLARGFALNVFGDAIFWRIFWLLPVIAVLALVLTAPEGLARMKPLARHGLSTLACAFALIMVDEWILSPENHVRWAPFEPKIPTTEGAAAAALVAAVPPRSIVLAPKAVASWVATHPDRPFLWAVAPRFLRRAYGHRDDRGRLLYLASGRDIPGGARLLARRLPAFSGVILSHRAAAKADVRGALLAARFKPRGSHGHYRLWVREPFPDR